QAVPTDLNPLSWQAPELSQVSWLMHSVPASPQSGPAATWLGWQAPEPLQVSAESHWPDEGSPQAVPLGAARSEGRRVGLEQGSGLSLWPVDDSPHAVPAVLNPLSWQAPELSQVSWFVHSVPASPQLVPAAMWLGWQAPAPLQVSAESHWPDEGSPPAVPLGAA